jgi:hypothetical protein
MFFLKDTVPDNETFRFLRVENLKILDMMRKMAYKVNVLLCRLQSGLEQGSRGRKER